MNTQADTFAGPASLSANAADVSRGFPPQAEMARRMREYDWSRTPLGPMETWPEELRIALGASPDVAKNTEPQGIPSHPEQENRGLKLLDEAGMRLLTHERPEVLIEELCNGLAELLGFEVFINYLVLDDSRRLRLHASRGIGAEERSLIDVLDFGEAVCGAVADRQRPIIVDDVHGSSDPALGLVRNLGIAAYACHPLVADGELLGTLSFGRRRNGHFRPEELHLMGTLSDQIATALHLHRLRKKWTADVQARRDAEAAAARAEKRFHAIANLVPDL
ncbi:MAG TPA: GAF domain-containing protein, partial [Opitutus sp.]|nr:GAF domain-containing protein [Opitutus sp.]